MNQVVLEMINTNFQPEDLLLSSKDMSAALLQEPQHTESCLQKPHVWDVHVIKRTQITWDIFNKKHNLQNAVHCGSVDSCP
jgi:hypothetical protein